MLLHIFMSYLLLMDLKQVADAYDNRRYIGEYKSIPNEDLYRVLNSPSTKTDENRKKSNYTKFMNWSSLTIDYSSYHSAIVHLSQETEENIALVVDTSCTEHGIIKLTKILKMMGKTTFCYRMDVENYYLNEIIQIILGNEITLAVLFQPWYMSINLLEKMRYHGLNIMIIVTIEIKSSLLRHTQHEDFLFKIVNLQTKKQIGTTFEIFRSNKLSYSVNKHDSPAIQDDAIISAYDENPVKVVRLVTIFNEFVQSLSENKVRNGDCDIGLPCRVPTISRYKNKTIWRWQCCSGALIEVLVKIIRKLKIFYDVYIVEDGTYNGMIYDVNAGKADIALSPLSPSAERFLLVDFTPAIISTPTYMTIAIRKEDIINQNQVLDWSSIQHMTGASFVGLIVATLTILFVLFLLENIGHVYEYNQRYSFRESFSYVNGLLFQRDLGGTLPRRWPGQIVSVLFAFGMTVVVSAFAAQLTATNIVEVEYDFIGLKDKRFQNSEYKFGLIRASYVDHWVSKSILKAKILEIKNGNKEGLNRLVNKSIDAFAGFSISFEYELSTKTHYKNKISLHNEEGTENEFAFAYSKKSKVGIKLSNIILQLQESGELQHIYERWGVARTVDIVPPPIMYSKSDEMIHHYARYPVEYGLPLALVLGVTSVFCVFLLLVENFLFHLRDKSKTKYKVNDKTKRRSRKISVIYRDSEQGSSREIVDGV